MKHIQSTEHCVWVRVITVETITLAFSAKRSFTVLNQFTPLIKTYSVHLYPYSIMYGPG